MPWCGYWGAPLGGFWWLMPLFGLVFMAFMFLVCFRGMGRWMGWMGRPRHTETDLSALQQEVASLRDELRKLRQPS